MPRDKNITTGFPKNNVNKEPAVVPLVDGVEARLGQVGGPDEGHGPAREACQPTRLRLHLVVQPCTVKDMLKTVTKTGNHCTFRLVN